jgi:transposase-like protein
VREIWYNMNTQKTGKVMRKAYSREEREETLKPAEEIGVTSAGYRLGINPNTIFNRRSIAAKNLSG